MKVGIGMTEEQNTSKEYVSLRELVGEITGIKESGSHGSFEGEYKNVQRIVTVMRDLTGTKQTRISRDDKEAFVIITKHLYEMIHTDNSGEGQKLFKRLKDGKKLTPAEYDKLIAFFVEGLLANPNHPLLPHFKNLMKRADSEDRFLALQDEVEKRVIEDFKLLGDIDNFTLREQRANEYLAFLTQFEQVKAWRNEVKFDLEKERTIQRIISIATDKGFDVEEVLAGTNTDMLEEITKEMVRRGAKAFINQWGETEA